MIDSYFPERSHRDSRDLPLIYFAFIMLKLIKLIKILKKLILLTMFRINTFDGFNQSPKVKKWRSNRQSCVSLLLFLNFGSKSTHWDLTNKIWLLTFDHKWRSGGAVLSAFWTDRFIHDSLIKKNWIFAKRKFYPILKISLKAPFHPLFVNKTFTRSLR